MQHANSKSKLCHDSLQIAPNRLRFRGLIDLTIIFDHLYYYYYYFLGKPPNGGEGFGTTITIQLPRGNKESFENNRGYFFCLGLFGVSIFIYKH